MHQHTAEYDSRDYRILDTGGQRVKAAAQFMYKGREISFSQVFNYCEVAVFEGPDFAMCNCVHNCHTVAEAIAWCDANPLEGN